MINRFCIVLSIFSIFVNLAKAQDAKITSAADINRFTQTNTPDTLDIIEINELDLDKITDLRSQFEKQNKAYSIPVSPNENLLRFIQKDEVKLSDEAMYWVNYVRDPSTVFSDDITFKDTIIVNPLFLPLVFKGKIIPEQTKLYDNEQIIPSRELPYWFKPDTLFKKEKEVESIRNIAYNFIQSNYPEYIRYTSNDLPTDIVKAHVIKKDISDQDLITVTNESDLSGVTGPMKFIERRYWTSNFESALQFNQNYISPNWSNGGTSNISLYNREFFRYNYNKGKILVANELELRMRFFTAPKDTLHDYKIGDDMLRIHSNFGYRAFSKWYYSFDFNFQTQLFNNYQENTMRKQAAFLSPMKIDIGIGMKYDLNKSFKKRHKKVVLSANIAPLAYNFMYSMDEDIDLGRHGFKKNEETGKFENKLNLFGSTIDANMTFDFNRNVRLYSRLFYFTSYSRVYVESNNILSLAISRFFSTNITLNLRYDDAVTKNPDFKSYIQINEMLSFGFNYKW